MPKDVRPSRYELRFALDLDRWTCLGRERIALRLERPAREITLHSVDLDISAARIAGLELARVAYDAEAQTATLAFPGEVPSGEHTLAIEWSGEIRDRLRGLYRSRRGEERYAATQFEAADARRAFPCFDEPEFKARFALELVHPSGIAAVANAPVERSEALADGRTLTRFAETPTISTYLVAFAVGPLEPTEEVRTPSGVPVRVWLPPGLSDKGLYARDAHARALGYLEEYTAIPYAYTKVDAIGLPDFEAGAMENPGAITYRTTLLAADRQTASTGAFKAIFSVVAHELTHMWWGDLVTMAWWNDLWLNESFASFVGEKATTALNPEWGYRRDVVAQNAQAFNLDSLVSTHPISMEARNADEASERFDAVTYLKGQGVLTMIESFIGEREFRDGVRIYLNRFREANAAAADFWRALDEASGRDVTAIANAWITEPGHPLVACSARATGDALEVDVRQERFFADPDVPPTAQRWPVPMVFRYGTADGLAERRILLEAERATVRLPGARWYYPNGHGSGFYRTAFDDRSIKLLAAGIRRLAPEERLALLDNQWALARASKASVGQVLELVRGLRPEDDRAVLERLAELVESLKSDAVRPETEEPFRRTVDDLFRPQLDRLGWDVRPDDSPDERQKRSIAIATLGRVAFARDVRAEARRRVEAHLDGRARLDPDIAYATVAVGAAEGNAALHERYVARMRESAKTDAQEEARFRNTLLDFEDPALVKRTADAIFTDVIREQDRMVLFIRMLGLRHAREIGWPVLRDAWDARVARADPYMKQSGVNAAGQLTPRRLADEAIAFLQAKRTPDIKENVAQAIERIRIRSASAERMAAELGDALGRVAEPA